MEVGDVQAQKIRLVGTVERFNRQAAAVGQNGKMRAAKAVIQLKKVNENHWQLWISIAKDVDGQRYDVGSIQRLRTNFIQDGKLTLELKQPPFNIMLRDCKPEDLQLIVEKIQQVLKAGPRLKPLEKTNPVVVSGGSGAAGCSRTMVSVVESKEVALAKTTTAVKRSFAQMDMSKTEATSIRKSLKLATGNLVISDRSEYPLKGFPNDLKRLTMQKMMLRKVDYRLQDLLHLKYLCLPKNRIGSIDNLAFLRSRLEHLNVSENSIVSIKEDLFLSEAFSAIKVLILNNNELRALPNSVVELTNLKEFHVANNKLEVLPYNMHRLRSLVSLKVNGNRLTSLPSPISLMNLNFLDISGNPFSGNSLRRVRKKVQLSPSFPTLFEMAGSQLLTHVQRRNRFLSSLADPALLPRIIFDFFVRGKFCRSCGRMCLRYQISYQSSVTQSLAQEFVRHLRDYTICMINCDHCSNSIL